MHWFLLWLTEVCDVCEKEFVMFVRRDKRQSVTEVCPWRVWHGSFMCVTWLTHRYGMAHSHVWRDWFAWVMWLHVHGRHSAPRLLTSSMRDMIHTYVWHDFIVVASAPRLLTWLTYDAYVWCDFIHVAVMPSAPRLLTVSMCNMTHSRVWCVFIYMAVMPNAPRLLIVSICNMTHSHVRHDLWQSRQAHLDFSLDCA